MIPNAYIQAWTAKVSWPDSQQVGQDLIIFRALCDLFIEADIKEAVDA